MSKKFTSTSSHQEIVQKPAFQMAWPQLQPKGCHSSFHQYLKEVETKFLKQAKEKALFIEKEAYEKGFAQGEKDGLELGQRRLETTIQQFRNVFIEIERQRKDLYRAYEREMLQLVFSLSKRVLHRELQVHEDVIIAVLREAFQYVVDRKKVIVHLHPIDYQYLLTHPERVPFPLNDGGGVKVIEDPSMTRGGCFLETSFGQVDATIEGQFDEIVSLIWERMEQTGLLSDR